MEELLALFELGIGEDWTGPAIALLSDMNTVWSMELMGQDLTPVNQEMQAEFIEAMQIIEAGLLNGFWPEGAAEKILEGTEHLELYPQYGDNKAAIDAIIADIRSD